MLGRHFKNKLLGTFVTLSLFYAAFFPGALLADTGVKTCAGGGNGFDTAIGCIPFTTSGNQGNINGLAQFFLKWGLGVGGGVAFVIMVFAGFQILSSSGDPHKLQAGKELMTSALAGLLLIIFSVYILRIVGVDILQIPGL